MNVTNMSIATRLNLAFGCLLLCLFTINGVGLLQLSDLKTVNQNSLATNLPSVMKSQEILENSWEIERALRDIALANEAQPSAKEIQQINAKQQEISVILDKFATLEQTDESKRLLQNMLDARLKYVVGVEQILQRYSENRRQMGIGLILLNFREVQQDYAQSIKAYIRYHSSKFIAANAHINEAYSNTSNWLLASLGGATVLSLVLSWAISSNIHNHVAQEMKPDVAPSTPKGAATAKPTASANDIPIHVEASIDLQAEKEWAAIRNKHQHVGPDDLLEDARCIAIHVIDQAKRSARKSSGSATSL